MFIRIENVVGQTTLRHFIKIDLMGEEFPSEYKPGVQVTKYVVKSPYHKCLAFRIEEPRLAILVNESGEIRCTGAKSVGVACNALLELLKDFRIKGIETPKDPQFQVENIVASAGLKGIVDLQMCVKKLKRIQYKPNQFPGVIYRMDDPKVEALIFASGKLVLTGAKSENEVHRSVANLEATLRDKNLISYL